MISVLLILVGIGVFMLIGFGITWLVLVIFGTVAANNDQYYRYPLTIKFLN